MLSKAHLTSHSRMSGSRWLITPLWLSGSWRSFLYSFSVYSCYFFLISPASVRSISFLSFIVPIFSWNVLLVSLIFLKRSLVFPILLFCSILCTDLWGRISYLSLLFFGILHSNGFIFPFLLCLSLLFFSQSFGRPPQTTILTFCISFSWGVQILVSSASPGTKISPAGFRQLLRSPDGAAHQSLLLWGTVILHTDHSSEVDLWERQCNLMERRLEAAFAGYFAND